MAPAAHKIHSGDTLLIGHAYFAVLPRVVKGPHIISLDSVMVTKKRYSTTFHVTDAVLHVEAACKTTN